MAGGAEGEQGAEEQFSAALAALVERIGYACESSQAWPIKVGAGVYAGVEYLAAEPVASRILLDSSATSAFGSHFRRLVSRLSELLAEVVPADSKRTAATPAASIAGVALLAGEHVRIGRTERLVALCPDLHLLTLLPFLGFEEAQRWVSEMQSLT